MGILDHSPKGLFVYFDLVVILLAIVANTVILFAICRGKFTQQTGYRHFLISLAACDLFSCCVNLMTMAYQIYMASNSSVQLPFYFKCGANILRTLQLAGFFTNLLNLSGMSIDHFLGVVYPVKYRNIVSKNTFKMTIFILWLTSFSLASLDIPINIALYRDFSKADSADPTTLPFDASMFPEESADPSIAQLFVRDRREAFQLALDLPEQSGPIKTLYLPLATAKTDASVNSTTYGFSLGSSSPPKRQKSSTSRRGKSNAPATHKRLEGRKINSRRNQTAVKVTTSTTTESLNTSIDRAEMLHRILEILHEEEVQRMRQESSNDICTFFSVKKFWFEMCIFVLVIACFVLLIICYGIIFKKVSGRFDSSGRRTKGLIITTVIFLGAFMTCWLPFMLFEMSMLLIFQNGDPFSNEDGTQSGGLHNFFILQNLFNSLLMTYPLCDPLIYAFRVPVVKQFIYGHLTACFPCLATLEARLSSPRFSAAAPAQTLLRVSANSQQQCRDSILNKVKINS